MFQFYLDRLEKGFLHVFEELDHIWSSEGGQ